MKLSHLLMVFFCILIQIKFQETLLEMQLTPFSILLRALLDQLLAKDQAKIFAQPVDVNEVNFSRCLKTGFNTYCSPMQEYVATYFCFFCTTVSFHKGYFYANVFQEVFNPALNENSDFKLPYRDLLFDTI